MNRGEDGGEFAGFLVEVREAFWREEPVFLDEFEPQQGFIGLLQGATDLVDPVGSTTRAAGGAVTGGDCGGRTQDLRRRHPPLCALRGNASAIRMMRRANCFVRSFNAVASMTNLLTRTIPNTSAAAPQTNKS